MLTAYRECQGNNLKRVGDTEGRAPTEVPATTTWRDAERHDTEVSSNKRFRRDPKAICEQRYNLQTLLVIDPMDPYKGPFLSCFLFSSCCVCLAPGGDSQRTTTSHKYSGEHGTPQKGSPLSLSV
ncbi:hypothetical protein MRX96_046218 [Rhipicephalus microplus]